MGSSATVGPVSIDQYLSNSAYDRFEYIDDRPVELNVGSGSHSSIQAICCGLLFSYLRGREVGRVATELRCRLQVERKERYYLPDVAVVVRAHDLRQVKFLEGAPEFVIEIRSPDDSLAELLRKIDHYLAGGAKIAWLILPEERCVRVFTVDAPMRTAVSGDTLDGGTLLPGLQIRVDELFS